VVAVAVASSGLLVSGRRRELAVPLWTTLIGAEATTWAGKFLIDRQRPTFIEAASALSPSFPSGHSTAAMAVYGFLAYLVARDLPTARQRFEVVFWTSILIILIGFSRIFLSVHFTSDVLSGFIVGAFWLLAGFAIAENRRQAPLLPAQPVVAEPAGPLPKGPPISPSPASQPAI
jgi:undecaprenyl-diphosphatase